MLAKLVRAVKEVDDAKKHLEMAQANLDDVSNSAISLMQEEERNFERAENRGMTSNNDSSRRDEEAADEEPEVGAASPPEIADEQENQASRGGTGEWAAKPIVENGTSPATLETQNTAPGKNWKPLTFKFNL
ncbi:hypothetical protein BSKO_09178 [Bryopsis sp. KO-2023]|nr:hypothetical protein BSKO_09178 [Bryopsis sp. KO-2023]